MPDEVQQSFGFALYQAQIGLLHPRIFYMDEIEKDDSRSDRTHFGMGDNFFLP
jgi:hypothetical protein